MKKEIKNKVTREEVLDNMQNFITKTIVVFGKPITHVFVKMKNGFILSESTSCIDPSNYNEKIGEQECLKQIEERIWGLLGYKLQEDLHNSKTNIKIGL